jgi:hypothetical protein
VAVTDIHIRIEPKLPIPPSPRTGNNEQQYRVFFEDEEIGVWRVPECSAARWLLANGKAERTDTLRTDRGLYGRVGWFANRTINEKGTPRHVKWVAMPSRVFTGAASDEVSDGS